MDTTTKATIFSQLVSLVEEEVGDEFAITATPEKLVVETQTPVTIDGRTHDSLNLLSVIIQKHHVGFYFMPVYVSDALRANLPDELDEMLKGKNCFHVKTSLSAATDNLLRTLIQDGIAHYRAQDWI